VSQHQQAPLSPEIQRDCLPRLHGIEGDKVAVPLTGTESLSVHTAGRRTLTLGGVAPRLPPTSEDVAVIGTSTRRGAATETRWLVRTGTATTVNGPGSLRTERGAGAVRAARRTPSRLRRRAPAIAGRADRRQTSTRRSGERGTSRMRVAPRKARPFVPAGRRSFLILGPGAVSARSIARRPR
jgi:hypothetical protein